MKTYGEMDAQIHIFLTLALFGVVVSFTLRPLYPRGNSPWYPLDRRLGGPRTSLDDVERRKIVPTGN
jgi:hypothetical protein